MKIYRSDNDDYQEVTEKGWYISWSNESGDSDYVGPVEKIKDDDHALEILKREHPGDMEGGYYYASVNYYNEVK